MAIRGSCLCGGVRFEIDEISGSFEICHCNRCRKLSGGVGLPGIEVATRSFRMISGSELVRSYSAPILYGPPAYEATFCAICGSPVPLPSADSDRMEIPAGLLDDDPGVRPDRHVFVELVPPWDEITDDLPQYDIRQLARYRNGVDLGPDFEMKLHGLPGDPGT